MKNLISMSRWTKLAGLSKLEEAEEKEAKLKTSIEGLAAGEIDFKGDKTIVLYDPSTMKEAFDDLESTNDVILDKMTNAIMGMIRISPPVYGPTGDENSCRGAWEVIRSGARTKGAGVGRLLYQLAASVSPTGKLMPDRREVSTSAAAVWKSKYDRMSPKKKDANVFDDESNAKTEDPNDDCMVHDYDSSRGPSSNFLNYAYDDFGGKIDVRALDTAHQNFLEEISWSLPNEIDINYLFHKAADEAFHQFKAA